MRRILVSVFVVCLLFIFPAYVQAGPFSVLHVVMDSSITPAQQEMLSEAINTCSSKEYSMLVIELDTPGGLGDSMRQMVKDILNAPVPVGVWVGPPGAHAASAGVFLVAASSIAGMAPQTTIGAASPVNLDGGDIDSTMAKKVQNDFMSLVRSLSSAKGRNQQWYVDAVKHAQSITAAEAVEKHVVEIRATGVRDFLVQAGERGFSFAGSKVHFTARDLDVHTYDPGFRYRLLSWLLHPQIAYFLLLGGIIGLFIEITHPGAVFPGVFGGMCLLLGLYAISVLPTNITGLLLIVFGLVLFGLEIKVTSYGLLGLGAVVSLFVGSIILFRDEFGYLTISLFMLALPLVVFCVIAFFLVYLVARAQRRKITPGATSMVGLTGVVRNWDGEKGTIFIKGEIWAAKAALAHFHIVEGLEVLVVAENGLTLEIEPFGSEPTSHKG